VSLLVHKKRFSDILDKAPIKRLLIDNGLFIDRFIPFNKNFEYWGADDFKLDFSTYNDVAQYTVAAVPDPNRTGHIPIKA
jgi:hypothetical protein